MSPCGTSRTFVGTSSQTSTLEGDSTLLIGTTNRSFKWRINSVTTVFLYAKFR